MWFQENRCGIGSITRVKSEGTRVQFATHVFEDGSWQANTVYTCSILFRVPWHVQKLHNLQWFPKLQEKCQMSRTRFIYVFVWDLGHLCLCSWHWKQWWWFAGNRSRLGFRTGSPTWKQGEIFDPFSIKKCDLTRKIWDLVEISCGYSYSML